jgi:hypothetical protein
MALVGPGLLDLASWSGLRRPADPPATRRLIEQYARAGGHHEALAERGGLPAERWALGWHRVRAAHWLLNCVIIGIDRPETNVRHIEVLRRRLPPRLPQTETVTTRCHGPRRVVTRPAGRVRRCPSLGRQGAGQSPRHTVVHPVSLKMPTESLRRPKFRYPSSALMCTWPLPLARTGRSSSP